MRYLTFILLTLSLSCTNSGDKEKATIESTSVPSSGQQDVPTPGSTEIKPGPYMEYHASGGVKMKGVYDDSLKREGLWISYYEDGTKWSESYYTKGLRDGHSITFYPNGQVRYIGEFKNDLKTGTWTFYTEAGEVTKEEKY